MDHVKPHMSEKRYYYDEAYFARYAHMHVEVDQQEDKPASVHARWLSDGDHILMVDGDEMQQIKHQMMSRYDH